MNLRDFLYLVTLADHCHFGKAASACFVTQPALSIQIKKLEDFLGVKLIERSNKAVTLTQTGSAVAERARLILNQVEELKSFAQAARDPYSGDLYLGIFPTLAPSLLPLIIPSLAKELPKVSFYLVEEKTAVLLEKLKKGQLQAAFIASPIQETGLSSIPLFTEEFLLALCIKHPLAKFKKIKLEELSQQKILLLEEGHCLRDQALAVCATNNVQAQSFRATSLETLRQMVVANMGITLIPRLACSTQKNVRYIPFDKNPPTRQIHLVWRNTTSKNLLLQKIATLIQQIMREDKRTLVL